MRELIGYAFDVSYLMHLYVAVNLARPATRVGAAGLRENASPGLRALKPMRGEVLLTPHLDRRGRAGYQRGEPSVQQKTPLAVNDSFFIASYPYMAHCSINAFDK